MARDWNESYRTSDLPWDTGQPSSELVRVIGEHSIAPCRVLEIGCGTGTNSVWLAQQGFAVVAIDMAPLAIRKAEERARAADVEVRFLVADVLELSDAAGPDLEGGFELFFDRGCYHAVRQDAAQGYVRSVAGQLAPGGRGLVLAGNANAVDEDGPPKVSEEEIRTELGAALDIVELREFRFDEAPGVPERFLGWSCLVRKR